MLSLNKTFPKQKKAQNDRSPSLHPIQTLADEHQKQIIIHRRHFSSIYFMGTMTNSPVHNDLAEKTFLK